MSGVKSDNSKVDSPPTIEYPREGDVIEANGYSIWGRGETFSHTAQTVELYRVENGTRRHVDTVTLQDNGIWWVILKPQWGEVTLVCKYADSCELSTEVSYQATFKYTPPTLPAPTIDKPTEKPVDQTFVIGGEASSLCWVSVWRDLTDELLYPVPALVKEGRWEITMYLKPGRHSIVASQRFLWGEPSNRSAPFDLFVRPDQLKEITQETLPDGQVKISGAGWTNATVSMTIKTGPGGTAPPPVIIVNEHWEMTTRDWQRGTHDIQLVQKLPDNAGGWIESLPFDLEVNTK